MRYRIKAMTDSVSTSGFLAARPSGAKAFTTPPTSTSDSSTNSFALVNATTTPFKASRLSSTSPPPTSFPKCTPFANFSSTTPSTSDAWASAFGQRAKTESEAAAKRIASLEQVQADQRKAMKALCTEMDAEWGTIQMYGQILLNPTTYKLSVFDCDQLHEAWSVVMVGLESEVKKAAAVPLLPKWEQDRDTATKMIDLLIGFRELNIDAFEIFKTRHCMGKLKNTSISGAEVLSAIEAPVMKQLEQNRKRVDLLNSMKTAISNFDTPDALPNIVVAVRNLIHLPPPLPQGEGVGVVDTSSKTLPEDIKALKLFAVANRDVFEAYLAKEGSQIPILVVQAWGS